MTERIDGGPAFPPPERRRSDGDQIAYAQSGMTLRDYFAAKAMAVVLAQISEYPDETWRMGVALDAYKMADAMLVVRGVRYD